METKKICIGIWITEKQLELIEATAKSYGFNNKAEYIRSTLFNYLPITEKVDLIYNHILKNGIGKTKENQ